jgi:hypothetical protein
MSSSQSIKGASVLLGRRLVEIPLEENDITREGIKTVIKEATKVRVLKPGSVYTCDFVSSRLNVGLDEDNIITTLTFG